MLYNQCNLEVAKIASKSDIRPEIAGVLFTKDKTTATDSFRLLEVSVSKEQTAESFAKLAKLRGESAMLGIKPFIVPAKALKDIKIPKEKSFPISGFVGIKHIDEQKVEFITATTEGAEIKSVRRITGKFPDYENIFPTGKPVAQIMINGELLAELLAIMAKLDNTKSVRVKFYAKDKPVVLEAGNPNQRSRGLLMPIKE